MAKIALPIACTASFFDDRWPLADVPLVRMPKVLSSPVRNSRAPLETKIFFSALPTSVDPSVDCLVTKPTHMPSTFHVSDDLLRREGILQELFDIHFELRIVVDRAELRLCSSSAAQHGSLGMLFEVHGAGFVFRFSSRPIVDRCLPRTRAISAHVLWRKCSRRVTSRSASDRWEYVFFKRHSGEKYGTRG
jgi:hypothetical protein